MLPFEPLLLEILGTPTAPFREHGVRSVLEKNLAGRDVPHFRDPAGNLIIGVSNQKQYEAAARSAAKAGRPLLLFLAHLDHPGFHGVKWNENGTLAVQWLGGTPTEGLEGARVWVSFGEHPLGQKYHEGILSGSVLKEPHRRSLDRSVITFADGAISAIGTLRAKDAFGGFRFRAPVWKEGQLFFTQAADDLVGAVCALEAIAHCRKKSPRSSPRALAVLTRGEEVGFVGAVAHFDLNWARSVRPAPLVVSLETSRTLPHAEIGKGPIVRLGDRMNPFSPGYVHLLTETAKKILPERFQRRIMDGGSCEASAALMHGFQAIGISVPLGNYHNQGFEGGPDSTPSNGPSPEFVHEEDILGLFQLCIAFTRGEKLAWADPYKTARIALAKGHRLFRTELRR
ncbi:MAG: hypothetical protein AAB425_07415 [Bdellovibrionota bacterium]